MTILRAILFATFAMTPAVLLGQEYGSDAPESISFQGALADTSGALVPDGNYNLLFKMYKGPNKVWEQNHVGVPIESGGFSVILSGSSMWPLDTVAFNQPIDLGITINGGAELIPRTPLTSATYALGLRGLTVVHAEDASNRIAPNLIGGASNNYVAPDVVGATISGGGGMDDGAHGADSVLGRWGTVGGGFLNTAGAHGTVGGGAENRALNSAAVAGGLGNRATGYASSIAGGEDNTASGLRSNIGGGLQNTANGQSATISGGENNVANGNFGVVGGGIDNAVAQHASTVGGGYSNLASGDSSLVGGGASNSATRKGSTVGGGVSNTAGGVYATIGGGQVNLVTQAYGTVSGGGENQAGERATVGGGINNLAAGVWSTIPGGYLNAARGDVSFAAGFSAKANHEGSFVWSDRSQTGLPDTLASTAVNQFLIRAAGGVGIGTDTPGSQLTVHGIVESDTLGFKFPDGSVQTSAAGPGAFWSLLGNSGTHAGNFIGTTDTAAFEVRVNSSRAFRLEDAANGSFVAPNVIGGSSNNFVSSSVVGATIGGGGGSRLGVASPDTVFGFWGTVSGGLSNTAWSYAAVGGGRQNRAAGDYATVAGGLRNSAKGSWPTIGGGHGNDALGTGSTVAGGESNLAGVAGLTSYATIGGGINNTATGFSSTVGGGEQNEAKGTRSTVPGGLGNEANGDYSLAAGSYAKANHEGSFVWTDRSVGLLDTMSSTASNQFLVRAAGGVGIGTNAPVEAVHINEASGSTGVFLGGDGTVGPHGIIFDDDTSNEGVSLLFRTGPNQLTIERGSAGTGADSADAFIYDRDDDSFRFNGGNVLLARQNQAASHQLELRNVGNITSTNYDGIRFSQGSTGSTTLGLIKVLYHNTGITDMSLSLRYEADLLYLDDPAVGGGNGRVGIGTTTPSERLEVNGNVLANNVVVPSDRRLKQDIQPLSSPLKTIARLNGVSYKWRTDEFPDRSFEDGRHIGFIAQDAEDVVPEAVSLGADGTYSMRYQEIIPILVEAIKEQQQTISDQRSIIRTLDERLADVEAKLTN